jgi:hypothetical protein
LVSAQTGSAGQKMNQLINSGQPASQNFNVLNFILLIINKFGLAKVEDQSGELCCQQ